MATVSVNDVNLQPVERALLLNADNRENYEAGIRAQNTGITPAMHDDRDNGLYADTHRSQTANL